MLQILLHSSKTMSEQPSQYAPLGEPPFLSQAKQLVDVWRSVNREDIARLMHISDKKAAEVQKMYADWSDNPGEQSPAVDIFKGDIYSGLQVQSWSQQDRDYAHKHLIILSGLYGALRACDAVAPYRLEMGYKLPGGDGMYSFWGDTLTTSLTKDTEHIINLSAVEYTKALLPYIEIPVITPKFLTVSAKTGEPTFVAVHAKIARGAFARWLIQNRIQDIDRLTEFADLGYKYSPADSTPSQPVFICEEFKGLGLSVRG